MAASSLVFRLHERGPELVREVLLERGWEEYDEGQREEEDWNLYWRGSAFRSAEYHKLLPWQRLNHHPKTVGITRKDCLARNLRRMRATFSSSIYDFSPTAFILPNDFTRFLSEYDHQRLTQTLPVYWICKPVRLSRGRGIFIFENIKDLIYDCSVIVQRYVSDPLLISGYKFDLRIYVCVKSFHPLTVYIYQEGLVRFSTEKYNLSSLQNLYAHLTNTSINKFGPFYKTEKQQVGQGCKWTMSKFRHFLHSQGTDELLLWQRINNIVTLTLLTIAPSVPSCPNCVELFGFDILIDVRLKPWLLEVNYSPALTLDCQADIAVKKGLIGDLIDLMSYKSIDGLRERAYRRRGCKTMISNVQKRRRSQTQTLPLIKTFHQPERTKQRKSKKDASIPVCQRLLDRNLNLILGSRWRTDRQTCPGLASSLSEPMNHDDTETETETQLSAETDVSSQIPDIPPQALRFKSPAASCRLPDIHRVGRIRPVRIHQEAETSSTGLHVPPLRVGGFIRTFPFNAATLKASRHTLDVKTVIQEIHKLTNQLAAGRSVRKRPKSDEEEEKKKRSSDREEKEKKKSSDGGEEKEKKKSSDGEEKEKKKSSDGGEEKEKKKSSDGGEEKEKKKSSDGGEEKEKKKSSDGGEEKEKRSSDGGEEKEKKKRSDGEEEEKKKRSDGEEKEKKKKSSDGEEKEKKKKSSDGEEKEKKKSSDGGEEKEKKKSSDGGEEKEKKKSSDGGEEKEKKKSSDGGEEKEKRSSDGGEEKEKKKRSDGEEEEKKKRSDGEEKEKKKKKSSDGEEKEKKKKSSDGEEEEKKKSSDGEEEEKKKSSDGEEKEKKKSSDGEEKEKKKKKSSDGEEKEKKKSSDGEEKEKKSSDREEKEKKKSSDGEEKEKKKSSDGGEEEEFDSLFWGPNDPPLISQTLKQL